jgi:hypothetical protein
VKKKGLKINFTVVGKPEEQKENYNKAIRYLLKCIKESEMPQRKEVDMVAK